MSVFLTLSFFILAIGIHETGHFFAAKLFRVYVKDFFIGFGPSIIFQGKETKYHLGLLLLGGAVRLAEENDLDVAPKRRYQNQNPLVKMIILFSGALANIFSAIVLAVIIFLLIGTPEKLSTQVEKVFPGSPAFQAGILVGDILAEVDGQKITATNEIVDYLQKTKGKKVVLTVLRNGQRQNFVLIPKLENNTYLLGVKFKVSERHKVDFFSAVKISGKIFYNVSLGFVEALFGKFSLNNFSGPVGIVSLASNAYQIDLFHFLFFCVAFSLSVGLFNLLPLPPLDGGKILLVLISVIIGQKFAQKLEKFLGVLGITILLFLFFLVTYRDISTFN